MADERFSKVQIWPRAHAWLLSIHALQRKTTIVCCESHSSIRLRILINKINLCFIAFCNYNLNRYSPLARMCPWAFLRIWKKIKNKIRSPVTISPFTRNRQTHPHFNSQWKISLHGGNRRMFSPFSLLYKIKAIQNPPRTLTLPPWQGFSNH